TLQRVKDDVLEDIKFMKKHISLTENKSMNPSFSETIQQIVYELIKLKGIKRESQDEVDIKGHDYILKKKRMDTNFDPMLRIWLDVTQDFLKRERIVSKKISIPDLVLIMLEYYVKQYPELEKLINQYKLIQRQPVIDKMVERERGY
ncbi:MAG: hypothetical protein ACHQ1D_12180, partial [Nitrososphaerales archaeon]